MLAISRRGWWTPTTMVVGITITTLALLGLGFGDTDGGGLAAALGWLAAAVLMLAGLAVLRRRPVAGSWVVTIGAVLFAMDPIAIPVALLVVVGGLWTGNLVLSAGAAPPVALAPRQASMTDGWYRWLAAAAILGALGFVVLLVWPAVTPDGCTEANPCWEDSAAWATWILSWMSAFVTAAIGAVLGALRLVVRHRTRLA